MKNKFVLVAFIAVIALGIGVMYFGNASGSVASTTGTSATSVPGAADTASLAGATSGDTASTQHFKDGTYSISGQYRVPSDVSKIGVTLTVKNDVVTDASFTYNTPSPQSQMYQQRFNDYIKGVVVGQPLSKLSSLSRVGGASLTTYAFDQIVGAIEKKASA